MRPCEGSRLVSEHLAFDQILWQGSAIDADEWLRGAFTLGVNGPRDEFLAGSAFSFDQDSKTRLRGLRD